MAGAKSKWHDGIPAIVRSMRREGYTIENICKKIGIATSTMNQWAYGTKAKVSTLSKKNQMELSEALKESKEEFLSNVKISLGRRAIGYDYTETKRFHKLVDEVKDGKATGKRLKVLQRTEKSNKRMPPDLGSAMAIMTNIGDWRHRQSFEHTGKDGAPLNTGIPQVIVYIPDNNRGDNHNEPAKELAELPEPSTN